MSTQEQILSDWIDEVANHRTSLGFDDWLAEQPKPESLRHLRTVSDLKDDRDIRIEEDIDNQSIRFSLLSDDWPAEVVAVLTIDTGSLIGALGAYRC